MRIKLLILFIAFSFSCQAQWFGLNQNIAGGVPIVKYGYLYNWFTTDDSRDLTSSDDWRVPNTSDRTSLVNAFGGYGVAGGKLKETGLTYWNTPNTSATNESEFNGRGGGFRLAGGGFNNIQQNLQWWRSDNSGDNANSNTLTYNTASFGNTSNDKNYGISIRLAKTATGISDGVTTTYTGNDGTEYNAIAIDEIYWLTSSLVETKFRNDDWITGYDGGTYTAISDVNWAAKTTEAMCAYDDDLDNVFE